MGPGSRTGIWDYNTYVDGVLVVNASYGGPMSGTQTLASGSHRVYHDVNGNRSVGGSAWMDAYFGQGTASGSIGLSRLPLAPSITGQTADQVKPTSARLGVEIGGFGHGTSAAMRMYYRVQGSGSGWSQTADQGDAAGYNYWTVTGLTPGTTYEYFARVWNNNGDTRDGGAQTFKTQSPSGLLPVIMALAS